MFLSIYENLKTNALIINISDMYKNVKFNKLTRLVNCEKYFYLTRYVVIM